MRSIRKNLMAGMLAALFALVLVAGATVFFSVRLFLGHQFDAALKSQAHALAALTTVTPSGLDFEYGDDVMPEYRAGRHAQYFQLWLADGTPLQRSHSLRDDDLSFVPLHAGEMRVWDMPLPDRRAGRAVAWRFHPQIDREWETAANAPRADGAPLFPDVPDVIVMVVMSRREIDRPLVALAMGMGIVQTLMLVGVALITTHVVRRGLEPLDRLGQAVAGIDGTSLAARLPTDDVPSELVPISRRLNDLLGRLESSFQRERRFSSSAAHELRTPIAELRSIAEVALKWPESAEAQSEAFSSIVDIAAEMERTLAFLLALARAQHGQIVINNSDVPLRELIDEVWEIHRPIARQKAVRWQVACPADLTVQTDQAVLRAILMNLIDNAVEYTPENGHILIHAAQRDRAIDLIISNTAESLTIDDLPRLSEPFWRKDHSRAGRDHLGLGLSLVHALSHALNIGLWESMDGASKFSIKLTFNGHANRSLEGRVTQTARTNDVVR